MSTKKKMMMSAAGSATGGGLDIDEVFSTNLYTGTNAALTVNTGLDQNTEGGMLWVKSRSTSSTNHGIWDTERTNGYYLPTNSSDNGGNISAASGTNPFLRDGSFRWNSGHGWFNQSGEYVAWAFRKAPKFFDVVTYTGDGTDERDIAHNLGGPVGCLMVKCTSETADWQVLHKDANRLVLNTTSAQYSVANTAARFGDDVNITRPTSTHFTVSTPGNADTNKSGATYVAYLFAHNDGDGEFGPSGDADIIKCGSYTGNGSGTGPTVNLGFEPQWLLIKNASASSNWTLFDNMRGLGVPTLNTGYKDLNPNLSNAEAEGRALGATATGFQIVDNHAEINGSGNNYIYMAIRRGPLAVPEDATEVFDVSDYSGDGTSNRTITTSNLVDLAIGKGRYNTSFDWALQSRFQGGGVYLKPHETGPEGGPDAGNRIVGFDNQTGFTITGSFFNNSGSPNVIYSWTRAPGYFDVVAYTGDGVAGRTVSHNLGVAPEMIWVKRRNSTGHWYVYHTGMTGGTDALHSTSRLNLTEAGFDTQTWKNYDFTDAHWSMDNGADFNGSGGTYVAYLFASAPGVSKVGSYSGNGTSQTIDCGFSSGARFVLIKRTDSSGDWNVYDTERGIVAGNDSRLSLNTSDAEDTSNDRVDPNSSGFTVNYIATGTSDSNISGASYIFYAIA